MEEYIYIFSMYLRMYYVLYIIYLWEKFGNIKVEISTYE